MKLLHYRNIGFPKTGTTWLWRQLQSNPSIDGLLPDIHKEFFCASFTTYERIYRRFNRSINLNTFIFDLDPEHGLYTFPDKIHEHTTHLSFTFRNPYELLNSWYNYIKYSNPNLILDQNTFLRLDDPNVIRFTNVQKIFDNWSAIKIPFKILFYDDLLIDPKKYLFDICDFLNIEKFYNHRLGVIFKTDIKEQLQFDNSEIISYINESISIIEKHTNRNLSHWKK